LQPNIEVIYYHCFPLLPKSNVTNLDFRLIAIKAGNFAGIAIHGIRPTQLN